VKTTILFLSRKGISFVRAGKLLNSALSLMISILCVYPVHAGIRCENDIISTGETTFEVEFKLKKCGEVLSKEIVRKETTKEITADKNVKEEKLIEQWHIRVNERGVMYCYPLTFESGRLVDIGRWNKCN
jgi:hypothetical protein